MPGPCLCEDTARWHSGNWGYSPPMWTDVQYSQDIRSSRALPWTRQPPHQREADLFPLKATWSMVFGDSVRIDQHNFFPWMPIFGKVTYQVEIGGKAKTTEKLKSLEFRETQERLSPYWYCNISAATEIFVQVLPLRTWHVTWLLSIYLSILFLLF